MKAMIMAAGRGERMRSLTDNTPKPLLKLNGKALIEHRLEALVRAGIKDIVINVSYRAQDIIDALGDGERYGVTIAYSYEEEMLQVGGGIFKALPLLGKQPFIVSSADVVTDFDFATLSKKLSGLAHLVLAPNPSYHPKGDFGIAGDVVTNSAPLYNYAGIGVFHPDLFKDCQPGKFQIAPLIKAAIEQQQITGEIYQGEWENLGTPEQLEALQKRYNAMSS